MHCTRAPFASYHVPRSVKPKITKRQHTWRDHRRQQQQQQVQQQQVQYAQRNNSRDTRLGRTRRQCTNREGGGGVRGVAAENLGNGAGLGGAGSPGDASAMEVEEESQVVTYGEQYDPVAGWLR